MFNEKITVTHSISNMLKFYVNLCHKLKNRSSSFWRKCGYFRYPNLNRKRSILVTLGIAGTSSLIAYQAKQFPIFAATQTPKDDIQFMGPPITDIKILGKMEDDLKTKVELLALKIQANFCKTLNGIEREEESDFKVERNKEKGILLCYQEDEEIFEKASIEVINKVVDSFKVVGFIASIYPKNPNIPSLQIDLLYSEEVNDVDPEVNSSNKKVNGSFSGRVHLAPYVFNEEDFINYHRTLKNVCEKHCRSCYIKFKSLSDKKSQLQNKVIGVGGISFPADDSKDVSLQFMENLATSVISLYTQLIKKHKDDLYTYNDRMWQLSIRGEQVMVSMGPGRSRLLNDLEYFNTHLPPMIKWVITPLEVGQKQERLLKVFESAKDWA